MMISSKGRYALRVMIDLAEQHQEHYVPLKEIAKRQNLSLKYMESIMNLLSKGGLVEGAHGKGGGYRLKKAPEEYTAKDILALTEGNLAPAHCSECMGEHCDRKEECRTLPLWEKLNEVVDSCLSGVTIKELMKK